MYVSINNIVICKMIQQIPAGTHCSRISHVNYTEKMKKKSTHSCFKSNKIKMLNFTENLLKLNKI